MAGHSQFKNIMHRKGAQDKKRAKLFAKVAREIEGETGLKVLLFPKEREFFVGFRVAA